VRGEDRRQVRAKEERVELGCGQPLDVEDVRVEAAQGSEPERVLRGLERQAQRRSPEHARRERVEELPAPVAVRFRRGAEPEAGRDELDVRTRPRQRRRELVVVRRREGRRIGEQDAHGFVRYAAWPCSCERGTSSTGTPIRLSAGPFSVG